MSKLSILRPKRSSDTITRTIRINGRSYDKINELADKHQISFNAVINQIIEYGLENLEEWGKTFFLFYFDLFHLFLISVKTGYRFPVFLFFLQKRLGTPAFFGSTIISFFPLLSLLFNWGRVEKKKDNR